MKTSRLCVLLATALLCPAPGCGFRLAGTGDSGGNGFREIVVAGDNNDAVYKNLCRELALKGVAVVRGGSDVSVYLGGDVPVLACSGLRSESIAVSVSGNSQELEYTHKNSVSCNIFAKGYDPYPISVSLDRSFLNKLGATLTEHTETGTIRAEAADILARQIIFRVENAPLKKSKEDPAAETGEDGGVTVVFNPTGGTEPGETTETVTASSEEELGELEKSRGLKPDAPNGGGLPAAPAGN